METWQIVAIVVAAAAVIGALGWISYERNRSRRLRRHFGEEYDRRVTEIGDRRRAEAELPQREARVRNLSLRALNPADRERFLGRWRACQAQFVDNPADAVAGADHLLADIMQFQGYPIDNPDDRMMDFCAMHPELGAELRETHEILTRSRTGPASTEELRRAFLCFRSLFEEMLGGGQDEKFERAS